MTNSDPESSWATAHDMNSDFYTLDLQAPKQAAATPTCESESDQSSVTSQSPRSKYHRRSTDEIQRKHPSEEYVGFSALKPRIMQLCTEVLWTKRPESDFKIVRLKGGTFNRIVSISVAEPQPSRRSAAEMIQRKLTRMRGKLPKGELNRYSKFATTHASGDFILRIPRLHRCKDAQYDFQSDFVTHDFVQDLGIDCPKIVSFEAGHNGMVGYPYLLQERIRGRRLDHLFSCMTHGQKVQIASQIGTICKKMTSQSYPVYGKLLSMGPVFRGPSGAIDREVKYLEPEWLNPKGVSKSYPVNVILQHGFRHWDKVYEELIPDIPWSRLCEVTASLEKEGAFGNSEEWYFTHGDFYPRNLMAEIDSDGKAHITGVLDWDTSSFQPKVEACKPPSWLWMYDLYGRQIGDEDNMDIFANCWVDSPEGVEIKTAFDDAAGPEFCRAAYHPYAFTARKISRWAWKGYDSGIGRKWSSWVSWFVQNWTDFEQRVRTNGFPIDEFGVLNPMYLPQQEEGK